MTTGAVIVYSHKQKVTCQENITMSHFKYLNKPKLLLRTLTLCTKALAHTHTHTLLKQTDSVPIQPDSLHTRLHQYRAILTPTDTLRYCVLSKR